MDWSAACRASAQRFRAQVSVTGLKITINRSRVVLVFKKENDCKPAGQHRIKNTLAFDFAFQQRGKFNTVNVPHSSLLTLALESQNG